jgi:hypothetical protein
MTSTIPSCPECSEHKRQMEVRRSLLCSFVLALSGSMAWLSISWLLLIRLASQQYIKEWQFVTLAGMVLPCGVVLPVFFLYLIYRSIASE